MPIDTNLAPSAGVAHWERRARLLAAEINAGWWLSSWLPTALAIGLAGTFALLWARWQALELVPFAWGSIGVALVLAAVAAWFQSRPRFESVASARVLLEERLGLHARLSSAAAGVGDWPGRRIDLDGRWPVRIRATRPAMLLAMVGAMLAAAMVIPVADAGAFRRRAIEAPADAEIVSRWVDELQREEAIDKRSASDVNERIEAILERPRDAWYEHATLEAAGTLREQTAAELAALARNLAAAEQAAASLAASPAGSEKHRDSQALAAAARQLALGGMRPAGDAGEKLGKEAAEALADLSPEQLRELAAALRANRSKLKAALARAANFDLAALGPDSDCEGCQPCGICQECREGKPCKKGACAACSRAGRGGISRGPGEAPMKAGKEEDLGATRRELVTAPTDVERSAAGELLDVIDAEHAVDESAYAGPQVGGTIAPAADGGGPSRVDNLLPREQDAVRRFFK
ncbi:MAG: hypothetical protein DWI05_02180 [Planctomycetota bacterium]|nr:MAG: hypothetical protein DWI05_02180 [Planctomycetota bacterium]